MTETTRAANAALVVETPEGLLLCRTTQAIQQPPRQLAEQFGLRRVREDRLGVNANRHLGFFGAETDGISVTNLQV